MSICLTSITRTARKDYECDACVWLSERGYGGADGIADELSCTDEEKAALLLAESNNWKVLKGEKYSYQTGVYEGAFWESHSIPAIQAICTKYDIYECY